MLGGTEPQWGPGVFLSPNSSPKGRNIGLCNEKLRAMSGEEVEGMEQDALAARVRQVGSSGGWTGQDGEVLQLLCPG